MQYVFSLEYSQLSVETRRELRKAVKRLRKAIVAGLRMSQVNHAGNPKAIARHLVEKVSPSMKLACSAKLMLSKVHTRKGVFRALAKEAKIHEIPLTVWLEGDAAKGLTGESRGRIHKSWEYFRNSVINALEAELESHATVAYNQLVAKRK